MSDQLKNNLKVTVFVVLTFLSLVYLAFSLTHERATSGLRKEAKAKLDYFSAAVFAPTDKYTYLPGLVGSYSVISNALLNPSNPKLLEQANTLLEELSTQTEATAIYVIDTQGTTIASSNWNATESFVGKNYAFRPYFKDAMVHGSGKFYGVGITSGAPGYFLSQRIQKNNTVIGVVAVKIDLRELSVGAEKGKFEMTVSDKNGVVFLSTRPQWNYRPFHQLDAPTFQQLTMTRQYENLLRNELSIAIEKELNTTEQIVRIASDPEDPLAPHRSYLTNSSALKGSDWNIHIFTPMDEVHAQSAIGASIAAFVFGTFGMLFLYAHQRRVRMQEREKSRTELETAHNQLAQQHQELQILHEELRLTAITDPLTGAYNRRFFIETSTKLMGMANRYHHPLTVVIIDIDHFKQINDLHGHAGGDKVLVALAEIYREEMRASDVFARFGGEEFVIALHNTDIAAAYEVVERMRQKIMNHPIDLDGKVISITVSCGISQYSLNEPGIEASLERADKALYAAKRNGRNRVETKIAPPQEGALGIPHKAAA